MLLKCWLAGSFFKEFCTLQSSLSTLNWRGKYHVLALDTQRLNRWGFTQGVVYILCSIWQNSISHLRDILQWNIVTMAMLLHRHFPISSSDFFSCLPRVQQDSSASCWKAEPAPHSLGLCPSQEAVLRTHHWVSCFSTHKQPCHHS